MLVQAQAKINIGLRILRKRDDGYHDLETLFHRIRVEDTLHIERTASGIAMTCSDPSLPTDERNLCVQAARTLFAQAGYDGGIRMHLDKRIPSGAGLGGGSSDAAAVLRALPSLCGFEVPSEVVHALAARIGADVAFFLRDGDAFGEGRGDRLEYFHAPFPFQVFLVVPPIHVSTAWAYARIRPVSERATSLRDACREAWSRSLFTGGVLSNDFEPVVFREYPRIESIKNLLRDHGAMFAQMSGSGSSVFGVFENAMPEDLEERFGAFAGARFFRIDADEMP